MEKFEKGRNNVYITASGGSFARNSTIFWFFLCSFYVHARSGCLMNADTKFCTIIFSLFYCYVSHREIFLMVGLPPELSFPLAWLFLKSGMFLDKNVQWGKSLKKFTNFFSQVFKRFLLCRYLFWVNTFYCKSFFLVCYTRLNGDDWGVL